MSGPRASMSFARSRRASSDDPMAAGARRWVVDEAVDVTPRLGGDVGSAKIASIRDDAEKAGQDHVRHADRLGAVRPRLEQMAVAFVVGEIGSLRVHQHVDVEAEHVSAACSSGVSASRRSLNDALFDRSTPGIRPPRPNGTLTNGFASASAGRRIPTRTASSSTLATVRPSRAARAFTSGRGRRRVARWFAREHLSIRSEHQDAQAA